METRSKSYYIHCAIMLAFMFGFGFLPTFAQVTPLGMKVLGVFIGLLYGWTFLGFFWTSCLGLLALALTGYDTIWNVMGEGFSNMIALQVFSLFVLVEYLIDAGFVEFVLGWFLRLKVTYGRPYVLIFIIFFACAITLMLGLGFGGVFFVWALMYQLFEMLGYKKGDMFCTYMVYGAAVSAGLSTMVFPFAVYPVMMNGMLATVGFRSPDIPWMIWNFIFVVLFFLVYVAAGKLVFRLDVERFRGRAEEIQQVFVGKKATQKQKIAGAMMCIFLFVCLIPSFLPTGDLQTFFNQFGMAGGVFLVVAVTSLISIDDKPITDWAKNAKNGIAWDLLIMFVCTTPVSNALESDEAGIMASIFPAVTPILNEMDGLMFCVVVWAFFLIVTQFAHNIVVIMAFSPTIFTLAAAMGDVNLAMLSAGILVSANAAFLTPGASSPAAAVHSNTAWVVPRQAYLVGIAIIVEAVICLALLTPLGLLIF